MLKNFSLKSYKFLVSAMVFVIFSSTIPVFANADKPNLIAGSAVLMDAKNGIVVYEKEKDQKNYPASTTKIMTALLTLENCDDNYYDTVNFSEEAVFSIPYDSSHIAMNDNETLTVEQSLNAIMLASANEVSNALAEYVSSDMDSFAIRMTGKAIELGAVNTNFANAHGLHDPNHYTTAYDMALIMKEAIKFPKFVEIINTKQYEIPPTERQAETRIINNSNKMIDENSSYYSEYVIGGKTGFTNEAGHTLVTYAKKGNVKLIAVVMADEKAGAYTDTENLLNYGFSQYENVELFGKHSYKNTFTPNSGEVISLVSNRNHIVSLPKFAVGNVVSTEFVPNSLGSQIAQGDVVGYINFEYDGHLIDTVELYANIISPAANVTQQPEVKKDFKNLAEFFLISIISSTVLKVILVCIVILMTIVSFIMVCNAKKRRRRTARYKLRQAKLTSYRYKNNY